MLSKQMIEPKKQRVALLVLTIAVMLLALAVGLGARTYQAKQTTSETEVTPPSDSNEVLEKALAADKEVAEALKKKNLIAPPPPEQNPIREVTGIIGHEAIINGKLYGVGDKVGDAEILEIGPISIKVTWKGKESTLSPMGSSGGGGGGPPSGPGRGPSVGGRGGPSASPAPPTRSGGGGMGLPPGVTMEQIKSMSPEERRAFAEKMRGQ
ncbi:hypothetical protein ACFL6U_02315 [Planctomycetota bacterium]